jgi:hypothetical protein
MDAQKVAMEYLISRIPVLQFYVSYIPNIFLTLLPAIRITQIL